MTTAPRRADVRRQGVVVRFMCGVVALATLSGCSLIGDPDDGPSSTTPTSVTPFDTDRLELLAQACGTSDSTPSGDTSFAGTTAWAPTAGASSAGEMTAGATVTVDLGSAHGEHSVDLPYASGAVTGPDSLVVGLVTGIGVGGGSVSGDDVSTPVILELGSCPVDGVALGDPLPDGEYALVLSGPVRPEDHDHDQQEYWVADPIPFSVVDGVLTP